MLFTCQGGGCKNSAAQSAPPEGKIWSETIMKSLSDTSMCHEMHRRTLPTIWHTYSVYIGMYIIPLVVTYSIYNMNRLRYAFCRVRRCIPGLLSTEVMMNNDWPLNTNNMACLRRKMWCIWTRIHFISHQNQHSTGSCHLWVARSWGGLLDELTSWWIMGHRSLSTFKAKLWQDSAWCGLFSCLG